MSVAQIIDELPKLTEAERQTVKQRLHKLETDEELQLVGAAARNAFMAIDRMEEEYAMSKLKSR